MHFTLLAFFVIIAETLSAECVAVLPYERFLTDLASLRENKIWISDESSFAVYDRVLQVR